MGTTLTGTTPQDTYDSLIKVTDNGPLTGSLKVLTDGLGNNSAISLSTSAASVTGTLAVTAGATLASASGNVGIGGTAITKLSVIDGSNTYCASFDGAGGTSLVAVGTTSLGPTIAGFTAAFAASTNLIINPDGGNVGIGVPAAPTAKLEINQTNQLGANDFIRLTTEATKGSLSLGVYPSTNNSLSFIGSNALYTVGGITRLNASAGGSILALNTDSIIMYVSSGAANPVERAAFTANGLTFNGDTAAANALDDYEEGTFTPTVAGSSTAGTATYAVQSGRYTKIGNQVSVSVDLSWSSGTGTGNLRITGLPFTNVSNNNAATIGFIDGIPLTALNYATAYVSPSSTRFDFVQSPTGGGSVNDVSYDAVGRIIIAATYFTA